MNPSAMHEPLVGCVDSFSDTAVSGWVLLTRETRTFPVPEMRVNGRFATKLRLTGPRPDVARVYGRDARGIYAEVAEHLRGSANLVEIVFAESDSALANGTRCISPNDHDSSIEQRIRDLDGRLTDVETSFAQLKSLLNMKDGFPPIPPKHLQVRVSGAFYPSFFDHGMRMFADVERILHTQGQTVSQFRNILDFGCGCGRFLIPLSLAVEPATLSGTDIDTEAVGWLKSHYATFADLDANSPFPPTKYADDSFDFVFSISIFTHLPEDMQHAWLQELARIIRPGGFGLFTIHGEKFYHGIPDKDRRSFLEKGFHYHRGEATDGLPDFYRSSFHTHDYVRREWSKYFEVLVLEDRGIDEHQDAVLVRKRG